MTKKFAAALALALAFFCSAAAAGEITVTDVLGRPVTVRQPVERVVLTFNFEEYIAATG